MGLFTASLWFQLSCISLGLGVAVAAIAGIPALRQWWTPAAWILAAGGMLFAYLQHVMLLLESAWRPLGPPIADYSWLWTELDPFALAGVFTMLGAFLEAKRILLPALRPWTAECVQGLFPLGALMGYRLFAATCDTVSPLQAGGLVLGCAAALALLWGCTWVCGKKPSWLDGISTIGEVLWLAGMVALGGALGIGLYLAIDGGMSLFIWNMKEFLEAGPGVVLLGDYRLLDTLANRGAVVAFLGGNGIAFPLACIIVAAAVCREVLQAPLPLHARLGLPGEVAKEAGPRFGMLAFGIPLAICLVAGCISAHAQESHDDFAGFPTEQIHTSAGTVEGAVLNVNVPVGETLPHATIVLRSAADLRHVNRHDLREQLAQRHGLEPEGLLLRFYDSRVLRGYDPSSPIEPYRSPGPRRYLIGSLL